MHFIYIYTYIQGDGQNASSTDQKASTSNYSEQIETAGSNSSSFDQKIKERLSTNPEKNILKTIKLVLWYEFKNKSMYMYMFFINSPETTQGTIPIVSTPMLQNCSIFISGACCTI